MSDADESIFLSIFIFCGFFIIGGVVWIVQTACELSAEEEEEAEGDEEAGAGIRYVQCYVCKKRVDEERFKEHRDVCVTQGSSVLFLQMLPTSRVSQFCHNISATSIYSI